MPSFFDRNRRIREIMRRDALRRNERRSAPMPSQNTDDAPTRQMAADPEGEGVSTSRLIDLCRIVDESFGATCNETGMGRLKRSLDPS